MFEVAANLLMATAVASSLFVRAEKPFDPPGIVHVHGPLTSGGAAARVDPPDPDKIMQAARIADAANVRFTLELIADYTDPVRNYPLVGAAARHVSLYRVQIVHRDGNRDLWLVHDHLHRADR